MKQNNEQIVHNYKAFIELSTEIKEVSIQKPETHKHEIVPNKNRSQYQTNLTDICLWEEKE